MTNTQTKMNRITVCTAVWKRPEIFRIWLDCWLSLNPKPQIVVMGSPNDDCEDIARQYPDDQVLYFKMPNNPVGAKWNEAHTFVQRDYFLTTGSDDVMDQKMWDYFCNFQGERLTLSDLYFYDTASKKVLYWGGYEKKGAYFGYPIGAHQLTRFDVMQKLDFKPFDDKTMAHEHHTERKLKALGIKSLVVPMELTGGIAVDIKSKGSYSEFKEYKNSKLITLDEFKKLSPEFVNRIVQ
jgi:hypothetical protein